MAGMVEIDVWQGDIAELEVDALVVPAMESLFMTTGPGASVKRHGGEEVERAAVAQGPIGAGGAVATPGGSLATPYVIHAVAVGHDLRPDQERLRAAFGAALAFAAPLQLRRIAVASLGTERGAFTVDEAATILVDTLFDRPDAGSLPEAVVFATANAAETHAFAAAVERARIRA